MKFSISLDQRNYLSQNGYIPFYQLLKETEVTILDRGLQLALQKRDPKKKDLFSNGRDMWRDNESVKQIVFSRRLVNLVYELTHKKPIRLAFDQFIPEQVENSLENSKEFALKHYLSKDFPLQEHSSISPIVGMFLICLTNPEIDSVESSEEKIENFRLLPGCGYFILPSTSFPLEDLPFSPKQRFLLIAYGDAYSQYLYEENDPQIHFLKSLGYVFGDKLNDRQHPILLR